MTYRRYLAFGSLVALSAGAAVLYARHAAGQSLSDDAPGRTARRLDFGGFQVAGRAVTINAPADRIHAVWRDPAMVRQIFGDDAVGVEAAEAGAGDAGSLAWTLSTALGEARVETRIIEDRPGEQIAWRSVDGATVELEAKVRLRPAAEGRGTVVEGHVAWRPPLGLPGHLVSKLWRTDPATLLTHALKRLKMLMETGEIATTEERRAA